jgi:hypothetical protein
MLSSYRRRLASPHLRVPIACSALLIAAVAGTAVGAETYFEPMAETRVEVDNNRSYVTNSGAEATTEGYTEMLGAEMGYATPLWDTVFKPQVQYVDFPQVHEHELEEVANVLSSYHSQLSDFTVYARYDHRDTYDSELASALFNPLNPDYPVTTPETGKISIGETRTLWDIDPTYQYHWSQRLVLGVAATFQDANYSSTVANTYIPYVYGVGRAFANYALTPRSGLSLGIYGSRYDASDGSSLSDGYGATLGYDYDWSKTFNSSLQLLAQRTEDTIVLPAAFRDTENGQGATFTTTWKGQISSLHLIAGQTFTPSGAGGIYKADQFQIEYDRNLSARFVTTYAVHYIKNVSVSEQYANSDYDYLTATASLKWMMTRTFYVVGGAAYTREREAVGTGPAADGMLYAAFGYQGLGRPR